MAEYELLQIFSNDKKSNVKMDELLLKEGIRRDKNLSYSCGLFDEDGNLVATGSCFNNTLRCLAVDELHQGERLLNKIVTHLQEYCFSLNIFHIFVYTKIDKIKLFEDLGFSEIIRVGDSLVFLENRSNGFNKYLEDMKDTKSSQKNIAAIVMNGNPFTLGHKYLVEKASEENDIVHLFIISEDVSLVPFYIRERLIREGTTHLNNIVYHGTGSYLISQSTFPSYFLKENQIVSKSHAQLDSGIFIKIAKTLGIKKRYVGDEPYSDVTSLYNEVMRGELEKSEIEFIVVPRIAVGKRIISASIVRKLIRDEGIEAVKTMIPQSTYNFFMSVEGVKIIDKIKSAENIIHH